MDKPIIGLTMGDAAGIGPEICVKALADKETIHSNNVLVIGDSRIMEKARILINEKMKIQSFSHVTEAKFSEDVISVLDLKNNQLDDFACGEVRASSGKAAVEQTEKAVQLALANEIDAITSAPLNKQAMHQAGYHFAGQTELLGHLCRCKKASLALYIGPIRLFYLSNHVSMKTACENIKKEKILKKIVEIEEVLKGFSIEKGRIAVAAFNPHAGEGGALGSEEQEEIIPAIKAAQKRGIMALGPFPADAIFINARKGEYDAVLVMYHDQGNIAAKLMDFGAGVTVAIGLPIIRTSVAHGTAFDIAGKGLADPATLILAIQTAGKIARAKGKVHSTIF